MPEEKEIVKPKKSNKLLLIGIPLVVLLIAGIGAGAYFLGAFGGEKPAEAASAEADAKNNTLGPLVEMEDFVVNIMHNDQTRFLKVGITLEAESLVSSEIVKSRLPQITDAVLMLLGNQRFDDVKDLQGKMQLKADLLARIKTVTGTGKVTNLFFTEFVVQ